MDIKKWLGKNDLPKINSFKDILRAIDSIEGNVFIEMQDFPFIPKPTKISVNWTSLSEQVLNDTK